MLRRLENFTGKNIDATKKAKVAMVRGMLVQKDVATGEAIMPASQVGLFWVDRDTQPTGVNLGDVSEYADALDKIAAGDFVQLESPLKGESYATDQFVATDFVAGDFAVVSVAADATLGKVIRHATAGSLKYVGTRTEGTHTLGIFEVL